jgi:hypothetical protein
MLKRNEIAISMDGRGAWRDNVFVERFWRSLKYEEVYLRAYNAASEAKFRIGAYIEFYNNLRPHSSLDGDTPAEVYFKQPLERRHNLRTHHIAEADPLFKKPVPPLYSTSLRLFVKPSATFHIGGLANGSTFFRRGFQLPSA